MSYFTTSRFLGNRWITALLAAVLLATSANMASARKDADDAKGKVVKPFNGKNLDGWKAGRGIDKSKWTVGVAKLDGDNPGRLITEPVDKGEPGDKGKMDLVTCEGHGLDIYSVEKFGDCTVELEVMVPKGSNSGIYLMGEYEIQVLDSYGRDRIGPGDLGGIYGAKAPLTNAAKKPGEWQKFVIEFKAPRFVDGKKVANACFVKITLNGKVIQKDVEMKDKTPGGVAGREAAKGPLMFQGNHGAVAYRNIKVILPTKPPTKP